MEQRLEEVQVSEALSEDARSLVVAHVGDSLSTVFAMLQRHSSVVAPVYNAFEKKWVGFIDVVDILTTLLSAAPASANPATENGSSALDDDDPRLKTWTALDAVNRSKRNPFLVTKTTESLLSAMKKLVERDAHYLPVFNEEDKLVGVLDSWMVLAYITENLPAPTRNRTVMAFGNFEPLATVKASTPAIDCFHMLVEKKLSAAAVVDDNEGLLVDNISATDTRALSFHDSTWVMLQAPVIDFLRQSAENVKMSVQDKVSRRQLLDTYMRSNCIYAEPKARWTDLSAAMVEDEIHRVYIAERGNRPAGYVDLNIMLGALLE
mmetsp:Transcript_12234/g.32967  ORF Transcript_12234/g.32967 Transcript_12234/m.32967 type:complete len:321 (+) Transcript_12234:51-1013(+)